MDPSWWDLHGAQCRGLPRRAPRPLEGTPASPLPALAQQELLSKGHGGVPRLRTMCPCRLAPQLVPLCPLSCLCCPTSQLGATSMSPSLLCIHPLLPSPPPAYPPGTRGSLALHSPAWCSHPGCWVLWVPCMGTQALPPPGGLPTPSFPPHWHQAQELTPCSASPQVRAGGGPAGSPHLLWGPSLAGRRLEGEQERDPGHGGDTAPGQAGGCPVRLLGVGGEGEVLVGPLRTSLPP